MGVVLLALLSVALPARSQNNAAAESSSAPRTQAADQPGASQEQNRAPAAKHKMGALDISVHWRTRVKGCDWFGGATGNNFCAFGHSLLGITIGQERDRFDWQIEAARDTIVGLPNDAVVAAPQGQLGLGGTYYAANGNNANNASGYVKQALLRLKDLASTNLEVGRSDGPACLPRDELSFLLRIYSDSCCP
jgi:hypothetical protein